MASEQLDDKPFLLSILKERLKNYEVTIQSRFYNPPALDPTSIYLHWSQCHCFVDIKNQESFNREIEMALSIIMDKLESDIPSKDPKSIIYNLSVGFDTTWSEGFRKYGHSLVVRCLIDTRDYIGQKSKLRPKALQRGRNGGLFLSHDGGELLPYSETLNVSVIHL